MQIAIGIGAMLLGSWMLNTPVPEELQEGAPSQVAVPPYVPPRQAPNTQAAQPGQPIKAARDSRPLTREEMYKAAEKQKALRSAASGVMQPGMPARALPTPPTVAVQPGTPGALDMPTPPTQGEAATPGGADQTASSRLPNAPTGYRPPATPAPRSANYSSYAALDQQRQLAGMAAYRSFAASPGPDKVYAGTQVASSGVSPYLQLFRNDTAGGTIDNYTTLVRPQLQQQRLNQQFGTDVFGLQRDARIQQSSLQRMQSAAPATLQSVGTPQFYMNGGNYYPGYGNTGAGYGNAGYGP